MVSYFVTQIRIKVIVTRSKLKIPSKHFHIYHSRSVRDIPNILISVKANGNILTIAVVRLEVKGLFDRDDTLKSSIFL